MRTDRNNNLIAAAVRANSTNSYTRALDAAGVPWTYGDAFPGDPSMVTIRILGDPVEGARAILAGSPAIEQWYVNHTGAFAVSQYGVSDSSEFAALDRATQDAIIAGIYQREGGSGQLMAGGTPISTPNVEVSPPTTGSDVESLQAAFGLPTDVQPTDGVEEASANVTNSLTDGMSGTTIAVVGLLAAGLGLYLVLR
jgi:hypothetical protein